MSTDSSSGKARPTEADTKTLHDCDGAQIAPRVVDAATVTVTDVAPSIIVTKTATPTSVKEPGAAVTFTVKVKNTSVSSDPVTLNELTDDVYGDLDKDSLPASHTWTSSTCDTGGTILPGATYTCSFTGQVSGNAGEIH